MEKQYRNLGYYMLLLIPLTMAGFFKTYIGQYPDFNEKIDLFVHLHAFIASIWILLLIIQPLLIRSGKYKVHRVIGKLSYIIFPLLILSFLPQMIKIINLDDIRWLFQPGRDLAMLIIFYGLAIYHRKNVSLHMRYMIATALVFLFPTTGRIFHNLMHMPILMGTSASYLLIYAILIGLIFYDRKYKKNYNPYIVTLICMVISHVIFFLIYL